MKFSALSLLLTLGATHAFVAPQLRRQGSTELFAGRKPFITGNWKLNPSTKEEALELASGVASAAANAAPDVAIFVPYPFIESVANVVGDNLIVGAEVSNLSTAGL